MTTTTTTTTYQTTGKNIVVAYLLWFFLGVFGAHRFYAGRAGSAVGQIALYWGGLLLAVTFIGAIIGLPMMGAWFIWWVVDAFKMQGWGFISEVVVVKQVEESKKDNPEQ